MTSAKERRERDEQLAKAQCVPISSVPVTITAMCA